MSNLLTAEEVAERWQVPRSHVYGLARAGRLPTVELGRYRRWTLEAVEALSAAAAPRSGRRRRHERHSRRSPRRRVGGS